MGQNLNILGGSLIWLLLLTLGSPILILFIVWRSLSKLKIFLFHNPSDFESLNFYDTIAGMQEVGLMISYALHAKGKIDIKNLRTHFSNTFIKGGLSSKYPVFYQSCTTVLGYSYKKRVVPLLDLEYHIREETLTPGKDVNVAVMDILGQNDRLRGPSRPKWEIVVLQNPKEGRSTLIFKINHALADAYSYFYLLNKLCGTPNPYIVKALNQSGFQKIKTILKAPLNFILWLKEVRFGDRSSHPFGFDLTKKRGLKPETRMASLPKLLSSVTVDFTKIKEISKTTGSKVLHVLLSLHYGALKRAAEALKGSELNPAEPLSITYMLPMPNHPVITEGRTTNHLTCGTMNLFLNGTDRRSQLQQVQRLSEKNFGDNMPEIVDLIYHTFAFFLPRWVCIQYEMLQLGADLHLVTPFVSSVDYTILGIPVDRLQLVFNGDDIAYVNGIVFGSITKGDDIEITIGSSHELFMTQEELDHHVKVVLPQELSALYKETVSSGGFSNGATNGRKKK